MNHRHQCICLGNRNTTDRQTDRTDGRRDGQTDRQASTDIPTGRNEGGTDRKKRNSRGGKRAKRAVCVTLRVLRPPCRRPHKLLRNTEDEEMQRVGTAQ